MSRVSDFVPPLFAALAGASTAVFVHVSPLTELVVFPTLITIDSEMPGVEFAIISDAFVDADVEFVTPATIRLQDESMGLVVVPLDPSSPVTFRTERVGSISSFSAYSPGEGGYSFHTLTRRGVRALAARR